MLGLFRTVLAVFMHFGSIWPISTQSGRKKIKIPIVSNLATFSFDILGINAEN